jgi:phosphohistidine phosphatase
MAAKLYLIRHGIAAEREEFAGPDAERPLTPAGKIKLIHLGKSLRKLGIEFDEILTSPLVRAYETADLLWGLKLCQQSVKTVDFLAPAGDVGQALAWLQPWQEQLVHLAWVGHEPDLSQWAERLVWGEARGRLRLKKAGVIGLELPTAGELVGQCQLFWLTAPGLMLKQKT